MIINVDYVARFASWGLIGERDPAAGAVGYGYVARFASWVVIGERNPQLALWATAEAVAIYGSFNNWIQTKNYCARQGDGWVCRLDLAPGKYTYKFLVDGVGVNDSANSATEDHGNGHIDSVIVIKPK